jgi:hypothetical protein
MCHLYQAPDEKGLAMNVAVEAWGLGVRGLLLLVLLLLRNMGAAM